MPEEEEPCREAAPFPPGLRLPWLVDSTETQCGAAHLLGTGELQEAPSTGSGALKLGWNCRALIKA